MEDNIELQLNFSDVTMSETDGIYKDVKEKMESGFPHNKNWMIRTNLTIGSRFGMGEMVLDFFFDGKIYIFEYKASLLDVFYNPDIPAFSQWAQESGWKVPQPHTDLVKTNRDFWKHFYDTLIIDCDYFDKIYGKRPEMKKS